MTCDGICPEVFITLFNLVFASNVIHFKRRWTSQDIFKGVLKRAKANVEQLSASK